ncbi:MAG: M28 family peptidase [Bacteroidota bacterium]|nr:M28 family peptidase [Bacteroidota bacterium]MDP4250447.1 M28 family peptidase [Bacteroidota bacterium]
MKIVMGLLFSGSVLFGVAQKKTDPVIFGNTIRAENLSRDLHVVASAGFEGRETATEGQRKAAAYIEDFFRSIGLQPGNDSSYQLPFPVYQDSLEDAYFEINKNSFELFRDYDFSLGNNYSASFGSNQVVYAGYGISDSSRDDYRGLNVNGKIVLVRNGYPDGYITRQLGRSRFNAYTKQDAAQKHGAVALLVIQSDFPHVAVTPKGNMYRQVYRTVIRPLRINISDRAARSIMGADYDLLKNDSLPAKTYNCDIWLSLNKKTEFLQSTDVLGYLEGTDLKNQLLIISAHYDHLGKQDSVIYYGADDDGSGTVSVLEIASAFSKAKAAGMGPRRSILFLANSGEEKGLWGSEFYTEHPVYPLEKTTADLNIDMIGRKDPGRKQGDSNNYVYVVGDNKLSSELHPLSVAMNRKYTKLELDYKFNDPSDPLRIYYRSDHFNFARKGVPVIFYFDGIHHDYHRPTDTADKINYDLLEKRARLVFYTAWEMANRKNEMKRDLPAVE